MLLNTFYIAELKVSDGVTVCGRQWLCEVMCCSEAARVQLAVWRQLPVLRRWHQFTWASCQWSAGADNSSAGLVVAHDAVACRFLYLLILLPVSLFKNWFFYCYSHWGQHSHMSRRLEVDMVSVECCTGIITLSMLCHNKLFVMLPNLTISNNEHN